MRRRKLTKRERTKYLEARRQGKSNKGAAAAAGVGYWITRDLYMGDPEFAQEVDDAVELAFTMQRAAEESKAERLAERRREVLEVLDGLVTLAEAARRIGKSKQYMSVMARRGVVPTIETPFGHLVVVDEIPEQARDRLAALLVPERTAKRKAS